MLPSIAISYARSVPEDTFAEFRGLLSAAGTPVEVEERDIDGPYAGIEWLVPTAVIVFLGKAYFDGILKEAGKDHYTALKRGLKSLHSRLVGPKAPEVAVLSTAGKIRPSQVYSLTFSLLAEADDGLRFKLLIQKGASEAEYEATVTAFIAFLDAFHQRRLDATVVDELRKARVVGKSLLLAYDRKQGRVVPIDPVAKG